MSANSRDTTMPRVLNSRARVWDETEDITDAPLFLPTLPPLDTKLHPKNKAIKRKSSVEDLKSESKNKKLKKRYSSDFDDFFIIEYPASKETSTNGGKDEDISADWEIGDLARRSRPENDDDKDWATGSSPDHYEESKRNEDIAVLAQANTLQGKAKMIMETLESWETSAGKAIKDTTRCGNH